MGICHFLTGLDDRVNVKVDGIIQLNLPEEETFPGRLDDPGISHHEEKLPDLRLKYHDQRNKSDADKLPEDLAQQLHLECLNHFPDQVNCNDAYEDPYSGCTLYKVIH